MGALAMKALLFGVHVTWITYRNPESSLYLYMDPYEVFFQHLESLSKVDPMVP